MFYKLLVVHPRNGSAGASFCNGILIFRAGYHSAGPGPCSWDKKPTQDDKVILKPQVQDKQVERKHSVRKDESAKGRQGEMYRFNERSGETERKGFLKSMNRKRTLECTQLDQPEHSKAPSVSHKY